jgi:quinol-cytochrome oxidoreductase complex cytochrome b subunit
MSEDNQTAGPGPGLIERIKSHQLYVSVFRHDYGDTAANRVRQVRDNLWLHLHPPRVRRGALRAGYTWCAGGISFLLFLVTVVTGVVLMFYYRPTAEYAYLDLKCLDFDVPFGMFSRNLHRWGAHAMVIFVMLHMFRVFLTGAYKPPREFNWVVGVFLLVMTLLLSFTGYLLPWDQLSMWAVTVGTNMARATPFIGAEGPFSDLLGVTPRNDVAALILGGSQVGPPTLLRFYVLHCMVLPLMLVGAVMLHFWRVRKDGGISGPL